MMNRIQEQSPLPKKKSVDAHLLSPPFVGYIPYYVAPRQLVTCVYPLLGRCKLQGKGRKVWVLPS